MAKKTQKIAKRPARKRAETGNAAPKRRNMRAADRELARRMGITHSAIYRHFPSKEALIERVYQEVYLSRWSPDWGPMIRDRSLPLEARLTGFYLDYVARVFGYYWVWIFVFF